MFFAFQLAHSTVKLWQRNGDGLVSGSSFFMFRLVSDIEMPIFFLKLFKFLECLEIKNARFPGFTFPVSHGEIVVAFHVEVANSEESLGDVSPSAGIGKDNEFTFWSKSRS